MILNELYKPTTSNATVVFSFARMQPPTIGHGKLIKKVIETAKDVGADHRLFLSHTNNSETDPLLWEDKCRIVTTAFPGISLSSEKQIKTPFQALQLLGESYDSVIFVVGEDRMGDYDRMHKYLSEWNINDLSIIEAGKRNNRNGVEGVSSSLARQYATENNFNSFREILPESLSEEYASEIFYKVRTGMSLTE